MFSLKNMTQKLIKFNEKNDKTITHSVLKEVLGKNTNEFIDIIKQPTMTDLSIKLSSDIYFELDKSRWKYD